MNKYIAELIGTFYLVFTIGCAVIGGGAGMIAPLVIGSGLMVMVYACGHTSGAHFNPSVTLAVWIRGKMVTKDVIPYIISQLVAAVLAALAVKYLRHGVPVVAASPDIARSLLAEFLFTFALAFVVLNVATSKETQNNSYYGLAIGFTVVAGVFSVGSISGGAFNPAVAVGISIMGLSAWANLWIFLVANFAGGAVAAVAFKVLNPNDK